MKQEKIIIAALLTAICSNHALAEDTAMVSVKRLTLDTAVEIARGAIDACRAKGIQIGVTVVDRDGVPQVGLRDTIASPITLSISEMKAYTAVNFNAATSVLSERAGTPIGNIDGLVMAAGGLPIQVAGSLVGGVGVSGAPAGETDEACAQAGIDRVQGDLEMGF